PWFCCWLAGRCRVRRKRMTRIRLDRSQTTRLCRNPRALLPPVLRKKCGRTTISPRRAGRYQEATGELQGIPGRGGGFHERIPGRQGVRADSRGATDGHAGKKEAGFGNAD